MSGNLVIGTAPNTTNVLTALGEKATTAQLNTLETNLASSVNSVSASQTNNYYTKTQTDGFLNGKVSSAGPTLTGTTSTYSVSVSANLLVQGINILNKINDNNSIVVNKAKSADVYTKTQVYTQTELDTRLNNSSVAWSAGLAGDGYHFLNTGTDALVIRTDSGEISANFKGSSGGAANDGTITFYKDVSGTSFNGTSFNGTSFTGTYFNVANQIIYSNASGAPTTTWRSAGTKLVLYDCISAGTLDYSIGVEPYNMFFYNCGFREWLQVLWRS